jgi:hypothetical protein
LIQSRAATIPCVPVAVEHELRVPKPTRFWMFWERLADETAPTIEPMSPSGGPDGPPDDEPPDDVLPDDDPPDDVLPDVLPDEEPPDDELAPLLDDEVPPEDVEPPDDELPPEAVPPELVLPEELPPFDVPEELEPFPELEPDTGSVCEPVPQANAAKVSAHPAAKTLRPLAMGTPPRRKCMRSPGACTTPAWQLSAPERQFGCR